MHQLGTVAAIQVKEGQTVKLANFTIELESVHELQQAQAKLEGQLNRGAELIAVQNQLKMLSTLSNCKAQESEQLAQLDQIRQRLNSSRKHMP